MFASQTKGMLALQAKEMRTAFAKGMRTAFAKVIFMGLNIFLANKVRISLARSAPP